MRTANLVIDAIALVAYVIGANPLITGLMVHEWICLGLIVVFVVHLSTHVDWCIDVVRRGVRSPSLATTGRLMLDLLTLILFMAVTVSGLMLSRHVLPLMDLVAPGYFFWNPIHSIAAKMLLAVIVVHLVLHWKWIAARIGLRKKDIGPKEANGNGQ